MIEVRYFANLKEIRGVESESVDMAGKSIEQLKQKLTQQYGLPLHAVMSAVNEEFTSDNYTLQVGDQVAFIPPVSGG